MIKHSEWLIQKSEVESEDGIVCAHHPAAAEAGAQMLALGGNAVDAAVAAGFAVGVAEPFMSGVGGIAQLLHRDAATGQVAVFDGTSTLPRSVRPERFPLTDPPSTAGMYSWPAVQEDANNTGWLTPAVPGTPACLLEAHRRFGRLDRSVVMRPAIELAANGVDVDWNIALTTLIAADRISRFPSTREIFFNEQGMPLKPADFGGSADRLRQTDLARTLETLSAEGPSALYTGAIATQIAARMEENDGLITADDLADYRVRVFADGFSVPYRDCLVTVAPEIGGGLTVAQTLRLLDGFDVASPGFGSSQAVHLIVECLRRAFVDRFRFLGDPSLAPVPYQGLFDDGYTSMRRAEINPLRATPDAVAGNPWSFQATPGGSSSADLAGQPDPGHTTHVSVIDRNRNVVSLTSTLGATFGSGVVVPGTGILLNNGTTWFDPRPGTQNSIAPGRRILWAGSPSVVSRNGHPFAAVGAPGGRKVISSVLQVIVNLVDFGLGAQDAVSLPRIHCEGREVLVDRRLDAATREGLREMGHPVTVVEESFGTSLFGRPNAIVIDPRSGRLRGGVNSFKPYVAVGL